MSSFSELGDGIRRRGQCVVIPLRHWVRLDTTADLSVLVVNHFILLLFLCEARQSINITEY
jgi:hypothetical protein